MTDTVSRWLKSDSTPEEEIQRLVDLNKALSNYGFKGDYLFILKAYEDYKIARVYPYPGGRGEQPQWVLDDFDTLALLEEREWLKKKYGNNLPTGKPGTPNAPALPTFHQMFKRKDKTQVGVE